jgi:hypothetical protein
MFAGTHIQFLPQGCNIQCTGMCETLDKSAGMHTGTHQLNKCFTFLHLCVTWEQTYLCHNPEACNSTTIVKLRNIKAKVFVLLLTNWCTVATITNVTRPTIPMFLTLTNWNQEKKLHTSLTQVVYLNHCDVCCHAVTSLINRGTKTLTSFITDITLLWLLLSS